MARVGTFERPVSHDLTEAWTVFERSATRETVTIRRVAEVAGVSRATVSRVMNGHQTVDPGMVSRVRAAAEELEYAPSPLARSLALGRTTTIALVVPDLSNPMFQGVLRGLSHAAGIDGHRLLIAESREDVAERSRSSLWKRAAAATVWCSPRLACLTTSWQRWPNGSPRSSCSTVSCLARGCHRSRSTTQPEWLTSCGTCARSGTAAWSTSRDRRPACRTRNDDVACGRAQPTTSSLSSSSAARRSPLATPRRR